MTNIPELLAPAGSWEALEAAIEAGADAVYFGGAEFSNRMRAKNFGADEIFDAIALCRAHGVKTHITLNTRLRDRELRRALEAAALYYEAGADAFIVADLGLASLIKEYLPDISLHASTQLTGSTVGDAEALHSLGFDRMVCPRELSGEEIKRLSEKSPTEIEIFVHGAHCVSVSGQCLMSWAMGGRSGNRGECAQPCRLPYSRRGELSHPLSLKDMCLAGRIGDIIKTGVASLKLEGRLKSADYVYGVTSIYRRLLDERRNAFPDETEALEKIFSRDGFTDGYYKNDYFRMCGMRDENAPAYVSGFKGLSRKVPLKAHADVTEGGASSLALTAPDGTTVRVVGAVADTAKTSPVTEDSLYSGLSKLGGTPYILPRENFSASVKGSAWLTASAVNAMRRDACEKLLTLVRREKAALPDTERYVREKRGGTVRFAQFERAEQLPACADYFDAVFLPFDEYETAGCEKAAPEMSPFLTDDGETAENLKKYAKSRPGGYVLVHTMAELALAVGYGLCPVASYRFNITNTRAAGVLYELGARYIIASPELPTAAIRDISGGGIVYGRIPLMLLRRCVIGGDRVGRENEGAGRCGRRGGYKNCRAGEIKDRTGVSFPVIPLRGCMNEVLNSRVLWCADKDPHFDTEMYLFKTETAEEVAEVTEAYINGTPPAFPVKRP